MEKNVFIGHHSDANACSNKHVARVSCFNVSMQKKKNHNLEPREEAHLHFRARLSNLCRPLLICSLLPRPSALNGNKPKLRESKRPRIRLYKQFKRDISKGIYTNIINISQFPTLPLSCLAKSSFRAKWSFSLIGLANWLWLFAKKLLYLDANHSYTRTHMHTHTYIYAFKRKKQHLH